MEEKIEILYIDDEVNNLNSFKANFRLNHKVFLAINTKEAEEILKENSNIRIIFCDHRMPEETGVSFLSRIKKEYPRPIRVLLTAYVDMEIVIESINMGHIFRFVKKPWQDEEIISCIEEANRFYVTNSLLDIRNEELQTAYNELDRFAYTVSHDLRDPLTGLLSAIKYGLEYDNITDVKELLALMHGSIIKLDAYIDSLRDYFLLRRGELVLSEIDFMEVFKNLEQLFQVYIKSNNIKFEILVEQTSVYKNDKSLIDLILHNLLSNAFKYQKEYSEDKSVTLSVRVIKGQAFIEVKDTGIGISSDYIEDIFKLFYRASSQAQGMGFGLYNTYNALLKLNGTVKVQSQLGVGTSFNIVIPSK